MTALTREEVYALIDIERNKQDEKWGALDDKKQNLSGYLLVLEAELNEAKLGWCKNHPGRNSALAELIQVAATAVAALEKHGSTGNPL